MLRSRVRTACSACCEDVILLHGILEIYRQCSLSGSIRYFFCMIMEKNKVFFICLML